MEVFYTNDIDSQFCRLGEEESVHCVKVMRHREGDEISVIDGEGTLYTCRLTDASPKGAQAMIIREEPDWGAHPYVLRMAVCPTKNVDRYEWFAEKATELGVDVITPVIGEHSERKVFKTDRLRRILLSASKQSLKGSIPVVDEPVSLKDYIRACADAPGMLKLIACCYEGDAPRISVAESIARAAKPADGKLEIVVLIGPEGDFSHSEMELAEKCGFQPIHLGPSRLRTETAALAAVAAVYFEYNK